MSITFIPISTFENDMFNENIVTKKWNDFIGNLSVALSSVCNIDTKELEDILQKNLDKHYTNIETKKTTSVITKSTDIEPPVKTVESKKIEINSTEVEHPVKTVKSKKIKPIETEDELPVKSESIEAESPVKTVKSKKIKTEDELPVKVSKSKKTKPVEIVIEEVEIKPVIVKKDEIIVKEKCQQILKNNKQCNGNITKNSKFCSRHTE